MLRNVTKKYNCVKCEQQKCIEPRVSELDTLCPVVGCEKKSCENGSY